MTVATPGGARLRGYVASDALGVDPSGAALLRGGARIGARSRHAVIAVYEGGEGLEAVVPWPLRVVEDVRGFGESSLGG